MTKSKKTSQEYATWADVLKGLAALAVVALFVQIGLHDGTKVQEMQKNQEKALDSLDKDSLSKTTECQNAVRYLDSIQKSH